MKSAKYPKYQMLLTVCQSRAYAIEQSIFRFLLTWFIKLDMFNHLVTFHLIQNFSILVINNRLLCSVVQKAKYFSFLEFFDHTSLFAQFFAAIRLVR